MGVAHANNVPLEGVEVGLEPKINLTTAGPDNPRHLQKRIVVIRKQLRLIGDLAPEQVSILTEAAKSCPVQNTLTHPPRIRTEVEVITRDSAR